jgi:signal transduction histidine kinase
LNDEVFIPARESELSSAVKHIVQNAVESIDKQGEVNVELGLINETMIYIKISDDGIGMSRSFISERLFKPFESTKGVSGMGLGMYQCREYIYSIHGDIQVTSKEGVGTTFTIQIPIKHG